MAAKIKKDNKLKSELPQEAEDTIENFYDDPERVKHFNAWIAEREIWASKQKIYENTRNFFAELYKIFVDLDRESEVLELVVADGFIRDRNNPEIDHPYSEKE